MNSFELKHVNKKELFNNVNSNQTNKSPAIVLRKGSDKLLNNEISDSQNIASHKNTKFTYEKDDKIYEVELKDDSELKNLNDSIKKIKKSLKNMQSNQSEESKINLQTGFLIQVLPTVKNENLMEKHLSKNDATISNAQNIFNSYNLHLKDASNLSSLATCLICQQILSIQIVRIMEGCKHYLCVMCCKTFYEDRIELGEIDLKCPNYKCESRINLNNLKNYISIKHYESLEKNKLNNEYGERNYFNNLNKLPHYSISGTLDIKKLAISKDFTNIDKNTMIYSIRNLAQKHVLQIGSDEPYMLFNKYKDYFCKSCNEPSLYGKLPGKIVKCLNCDKTFCKFCMKILSSSHFDLSSQNHCKIYFRKRGINSILKPLRIRKDSIMRKFYIRLIIMTIGFLLLMKFLHYKILNFFELLIDVIFCRLSSKFNKIKHMIYYIMIMINIPILIFSIFIGNLILPFFPVTHYLVDNLK